MEKEIESLLVRYVRRELDKAQTEKVEEWILESEEHRKTALRYFRLEQYGHTLKRLREAERKNLSVVADRNIRAGRVRYRGTMRTIRWAVAAACFAALLVTGAFSVKNYEQRHALTCEYQSDTASLTPFILEDGTRVWLNANSRLLYPSQFKRHSRTVSLEGQAFFEVSPDAARPFTVNTSKGDVMVLGTSFDVVSYPDATSDFSTTLVSGKVNVDVICSGSRRSITMLPGQKFTFSPETQVAHLAEVDVESLTSWRTGRIVANHTPLKDVLSIISNTYGVRFIINDPDKIKDICSGAFEKQDVDQILLTIEKVTGVHFSMVGGSADGRRRYIVY